MTAPGGRVLLILSDPKVAAPVSLYLARCGHQVTATCDPVTAHKQAAQDSIDLVIITRQSGYDSLELLSAVHRARPRLPIIVLAAHPASADCIQCLNRGAVDYLPTSVSPDELTARVQAHLRLRSQHTRADPGRLRVGNIELDRVSRRLARGKSELTLTPRESDILAHLMQHAGLVISRARLHRVVWGYDFDPGTNIVEVYVGYLRRKLGLPTPIETVRGRGYRLTG